MGVNSATWAAFANAMEQGDLRAGAALMRQMADAVDSLSDTELGFVDGVTAGTVTASKALVVDSNKDLTGLRNLTSVGSLTTTRAVSSGTALKVGGVAFVDVAASDTVLATASNNSFVAFAQTYSIPANTIGQGTVVRVQAHVVTNDVSGTDTLTCELRIGGTSLIATTAVDPGAVTDHHVLEFTFIGRAAAGATASCVGYGWWATNTGGTVVSKPAILAPTNFATNGALVVDVRAKWSSNTANTSARLESLVVDVVG